MMSYAARARSIAITAAEQALSAAVMGIVAGLAADLGAGQIQTLEATAKMRKGLAIAINAYVIATSVAAELPADESCCIHEYPLATEAGERARCMNCGHLEQTS